MDNIKRMDVKEFHEKGYLQEVNRTFLHPLGLALEIVVDDDGNEKIGGIWDGREYEEGIYYDLENSPVSRLDKFRINRDFIGSEMIKGKEKRLAKLGFDIEPIIYNSGKI